MVGHWMRVGPLWVVACGLVGLWGLCLGSCGVVLEILWNGIGIFAMEMRQLETPFLYFTP